MSEITLESQLFDIIRNEKMPEHIKLAKVDMLVCLGVDVNHLQRGFSALAIAKDKGLTTICDFLDKQKAVEKRVSEEDALKMGKYLIDIIRFDKGVDEFMSTVDAGANLDAKDDEKGKTALDWASKYGYKQMVDVLIKNGADLNAQDNEGVTPLMTAASWRYVDIVYELIVHGADINIKDYNGDDLLSKYAREENVLAKINEAKQEISSPVSNNITDVIQDANIARIFYNKAKVKDNRLASSAIDESEEIPEALITKLLNNKSR